MQSSNPLIEFLRIIIGLSIPGTIFLAYFIFMFLDSPDNPKRTIFIIFGTLFIYVVTAALCLIFSAKEPRLIFIPLALFAIIAGSAYMYDKDQVKNSDARQIAKLYNEGSRDFVCGDTFIAIEPSTTTPEGDAVYLYKKDTRPAWIGYIWGDKKQYISIFTDYVSNPSEYVDELQLCTNAAGKSIFAVYQEKPYVDYKNSQK